MAEPRPASGAGTSDIAMVSSGKNDVPAPRPSNTNVKERCGKYGADSGKVANNHMAAAMAASPNISTVRGPWRAMSRAASPRDNKATVIVMGRNDRGELPQQMLCDVLRTSQNTVVMWLNELEQAGFISRVRDAADRRKHNVAITSAGATALERAELEMRRLEDEVLSRLTGDERAQLRKLLAKALDDRGIQAADVRLPPRGQWPDRDQGGGKPLSAVACWRTVPDLSSRFALSRDVITAPAIS
jgi:DNA-binding MarR family transcriptional regulator